MKKINLGQKELIHFVGIGGSGMSGIAELMFNLNYRVSGSDVIDGLATQRLRKIGVEVFIGHDKEHIAGADAVVISSAVSKKNPEIIAARCAGVPVVPRALMLVELMRLRQGIAVAGTHGKTTTTSLVANILQEAGLDPTVINGGVINSIKNTAQLGKGDWAVIESDESDGSFLKLPINYSIVTNIDYEHIDYYKNYKNLENSFLKFINKTPPTGKAIICLDNNNIKKILPKIKNKNIILYGESKNADYIIEKIKYKFDSTSFDLCFKDKDKRKRKIKNINVKLLGRHNVLNAAAAFIVCINLGANINTAKKSLKEFSGVQRRMTKVFSKNKNDFYDDYAHHPTEIKSILEGVNNVNSKRKIVSIFEPHRYSRVASLKKEFSKCFSKSNVVIISPLYPAGEKKDTKYSLIKFAKLISKNSKTQVILVKNEKELSNYLKKNLISNEIVIGMGAGSISKWMTQLKFSL